MRHRGAQERFARLQLCVPCAAIWHRDLDLPTLDDVEHGCRMRVHRRLVSCLRHIFQHADFVILREELQMRQAMLHRVLCTHDGGAQQHGTACQYSDFSHTASLVEYSTETISENRKAGSNCSGWGGFDGPRRCYPAQARSSSSMSIFFIGSMAVRLFAILHRAIF